MLPRQCCPEPGGRPVKIMRPEPSKCDRQDRHFSIRYVRKNGRHLRQPESRYAITITLYLQLGESTHPLLPDDDTVPRGDAKRTAQRAATAAAARTSSSALASLILLHCDVPSHGSHCLTGKCYLPLARSVPHRPSHSPDPPDIGRPHTPSRMRPTCNAATRHPAGHGMPARPATVVCCWLSSVWLVFPVSLLTRIKERYGIATVLCCILVLIIRGTMRSSLI